VIDIPVLVIPMGWVVYVYRPDKFKNSIGESSTAPMTAPVGQKELRSLGLWKLGGGCGRSNADSRGIDRVAGTFRPRPTVRIVAEPRIVASRLQFKDRVQQQVG